MRLLVLVVLVSACVQAEVVRLGTVAPLPAVAPESVLVFRTPPKQPYTEIAIVSVKSTRNISQADLVRALQTEAAKLGASGLVLEVVDEQRARGATLVGGFVVINKDHVARAIAIRW